MKLLTICFASLLLFSCSSPDNSSKIQTLKVFESCTLDKLAQGSERLWNVDCMAADKSEIEPFRNKIGLLQTKILETDSLSSSLMSRLNQLRSKILGKSPKESKWMNKPIEIDYSYDMKLDKDALPNEQLVSEIIEEIETYRDKLCGSIIESHFPSLIREPYYFKKPKISNFQTGEQKAQIIEKELKKSRVSEDDELTIKEIMNILTKKRSLWKSMLSSDQDWIDYSMSLLSIQQQILEARSIALRAMSTRMTCCASYDFTRIEPVIAGSSVGCAGDTIQFEVFLAAYNELRENEASVEGKAKLIKIENGKAYFEAILPKSGEFNLNGELSTYFSFDRKRTRKWSHTIKVLEPQ